MRELGQMSAHDFRLGRERGEMYLLCDYRNTRGVQARAICGGNREIARRDRVQPDARPQPTLFRPRKSETRLVHSARSIGHHHDGDTCAHGSGEIRPISPFVVNGSSNATRSF